MLPGSYSLSVAQVRSTGEVVYQYCRARFKVPENGSIDVGELVLQELGSLRIKIHRPWSSIVAMHESYKLYSKFRLDSGELLVPDLPPGEYQLLLKTEDAGLIRRVTTVSPGTITELQIN